MFTAPLVHGAPSQSSGWAAVLLGLCLHCSCDKHKWAQASFNVINRDNTCKAATKVWKYVAQAVLDCLGIQVISWADSKCAFGYLSSAVQNWVLQEEVCKVLWLGGNRIGTSEAAGHDGYT